MPLYAYKCRNCLGTFDSTSRSLTTCPHCLSPNIVRDYSSVQLARPTFQPHWNYNVGAYVSNSREFDDVLKLRAEEAGTTYTRVDPGDLPRPITDDYIYEDHARTIHDNNIDPHTLVE